MPMAFKNYNSRPMNRKRGINMSFMRFKIFKGDRKDIAETENPTGWVTPSGYGQNAGRRIGMMENNC
jgi:hypothetical protein